MIIKESFILSYTLHIMKKIFTRSLLGLVWAIGLFSFPVTTLAQGTDQSVSNLWDVVVRFCNENGQWEPGKMKDLFFEADTNTPYDLCMYVNNNGPTDVDVILNFVDGTITADDSQNKACQPEGTKTNFGQHVDYISEVWNVMNELWMCNYDVCWWSSRRWRSINV